MGRLSYGWLSMLKFMKTNLLIILLSALFLIATACTQRSQSKTDSTLLQTQNEKQDADSLTSKGKPDSYYENIAKKLEDADKLNTITRSVTPKDEKIETGKTAILKKDWGEMDHPICSALNSAVVNFPKDEYLHGYGGVRIDLLADIITSESKTGETDLSIVEWEDVPEADRDALYFSLRYAKTGQLDVDVNPHRYRFFDEPRIWAGLERGYLNLEEYLTPEFRKAIPLASSLKSGKIRVQRHDLGNNHVLFMQSYEPDYGARTRKPPYVNSTFHVNPILSLERETGSGPRYIKLADLMLNGGSKKVPFLVSTYGGKVQILSRNYSGVGTNLTVVQYDPETFSSLEQYVAKHEQPENNRRLRYAGTPGQICQITLKTKPEWLPPKLDFEPVPYTPRKRAYQEEIPCISEKYCYSKLDEMQRNCNTGDSCDRAASLLKIYRHTGKPTSFTNVMGLSDVKPTEVLADTPKERFEGSVSNNRFVQRLDRTVDPQYIDLKRRGRSPDSDMCKRLETRLSTNLSALAKIGQWEIPLLEDPWGNKPSFDLRWVTWLDSHRLKAILEGVFPYEPIIWTDVPQELAAQWEFDILQSSQITKTPTSERPERGAETTRAFEYFRYVDVPVGEDAAVNEDRPIYRLFKYKYKSDASGLISPHMPYPETPEYDDLKAAYAVSFGEDLWTVPSMPTLPVMEFKKEDRLFFIGQTEGTRAPNSLSSLSIKYFDPRKNPGKKTKIKYRRDSAGPVINSSYCRIDFDFSSE